MLSCNELIGFGVGNKTPPGTVNFILGTTEFIIPSDYYTLTVTLKGGGGGGADGWGYAGTAGTETYVTATGIDMHAYGGAPGATYSTAGWPGAAAGGSATGGTTNTTGGGSAGGWGGNGPYWIGGAMRYGQPGGAGGLAVRIFTPGELIEGQAISIIVGNNGLGGAGSYPGQPGVVGLATISWT